MTKKVIVVIAETKAKKMVRTIVIMIDMLATIMKMVSTIVLMGMLIILDDNEW